MSNSKAFINNYNLIDLTSKIKDDLKIEFHSSIHKEEFMDWLKNDLLNSFGVYVKMYDTDNTIELLKFEYVRLLHHCQEYFKDLKHAILEGIYDDEDLEILKRKMDMFYIWLFKNY